MQHLSRILLSVAVLTTLVACSSDTTTATTTAESDSTAPCGAEQGSATDLSAEPVHWHRYGGYHRWTDSAGCDVRIDVITQLQGAQHCGWESVTSITIGTPIGTPASTMEGPADGARTYLWDPNDLLAGVVGIESSVSVRSDALPDTAADTGFRDGGAQLWLDRDDRRVLFRLDGTSADRFVIDEPRRVLCS